jgi:hypothetical protein
MMAQKTNKNQYPAYAVTSDDGTKNRRNQILAYALKSDDGRKMKDR